MTINGLLFLFVFLPLALLVYHMSNDKIKEYLLLIISMLFYAFGSLEYLMLFVVSTVVTVALGRIMNRVPNVVVKRILLVAGIVLNIGILSFYKYTDFAISTYNNLFGMDVAYKNYALPLGISFFTFKAVSYLADIYRGAAVLEKNPVHDALYLSFFTQIQAGPLARYSEMGYEKDSKVRRELFENGVFRFLVGFNKKVLISNVIGKITVEVFNTPFENFSVLFAWLGALAFVLQLYFDFSGYSDMAIGLSGMFGYKCMENFNYPFISKSYSEFWKRWHISLGRWFQNYIYIPLGGSRTKHEWQVYFNLLVVWILTGIWHGAAWNYVAWGLGCFILVSFERLTGWPKKLKHKASKIIYQVAAIILFIINATMFNCAGVRNGLIYIKHMFICAPNELATNRALFLIKDYGAILFIAILLNIPIVPWLDEKTKDNKVLHIVYETALALIVFAGFIWSISYVISGQNNPFAYANF